MQQHPGGGCGGGRRTEVEARRRGTGSQQPLCPFDLRIWTATGCGTSRSPTTLVRGPGAAVFDDPVHGKGMAVLLRRRSDRRFDIYRQPGLTLDPEIAQVGGELGRMAGDTDRPGLVPHQLDGIAVDVRLTDVVGRVVQGIDDRNAGGGTGERYSPRSGPWSSTRPRCRCS